jgi:protein-tyrosine-phosphatase
MERIFNYIFSMKILFVCTANICRSVIAEGILKNLLSEHTGKHIVSVNSAGVDALEDSTPNRYTIEVCDKRGISIGSRTAQQLTREMLGEMDLILCMEKNHKQHIISAFPKFAEKSFLLKEYLHEGPLIDAEIEDPVGKSKKHYEKYFNRIEEEIQRITPLILTNTMKVLLV